MVVPVSLDPGRHDPRSPYFEGCRGCGKPGAPDPCRECQYEQQRAEAEAAHWEEQARKHQEKQRQQRVTQGLSWLLEGQDA